MASPELEAKIKQVKEKYGEKKPESFDQQVERVKQKYSPIGRLKQMRKTMSDHLKKEHIGFKKLENKVESEGYSEESAKKIAAAVGRKKYGKKGMEEKAKAGMHKAEGDLPNIAKPRPKVGTKNDPEKFSAGYGVNPSTKLKGVSNAGMSVRAARTNPEDKTLFQHEAKRDHEQTLRELKAMKKPNLTKAEEHLEKCASCGGPMRKSEDDAATHSHKGIRLKHMKDLGDGHHAFKILDGHHAGKWTKLHESEAEPVQKAAPHLEKHVEGVSDEKFDRCVDHVKHQGGKYNAYAVCTASLKKMRQYAAKDKMEKGAGEDDAVGGLRKMKAALHADSNGSGPAMEKSETGHEKGVHTADTAAHLTPGKASATGSQAGNQIRRGVPQYAKEQHQKKLGELKSMKKPNLEKSEWEVPGEVP